MGSFMKADIKANTIYDIDLDYLKARGIKAFLFDIDNTLEEYATSVPGEKLISFIKNLSDNGFIIGILSNAKAERAKLFVAGFPIEDYPKILYLGKAGKPLKKGYKMLSDMLGVDIKETVMVGDQLFTDILGGNRAGCMTILVNPINIKIEPAFVRFKRLFEKPFL